MTNNNNNDKGFNVEMNSIPPPSLPPPSMTMMTGIVGGDSMKIINRSIQQQQQQTLSQQPPPAYKRNQMMTKRIIWGKEIPHIVQHNHHNHHHLNHHNHHHLSSSTNNNNNTGNNTQTFDNYVMILGSNPLITIRPINIRDEMATSSTSSYGDPYTSRVFEMDNLRNYFQLNEPESSTSSTNHHSSSSSSSISSLSATTTTNPIRFRYEYFLSLLDPTMPRLTNCGNYYRMRYAVYVAIKNSDSFGGGGGGGIGGGNIDFNSITNDWRNKQYQQQKVSPSSSLSSSKRKLVHIGEIHLYTIVPESIVSIGRRYYNNQHSIDYHNSNSTATSILPSIHYENISFFSSQIPLSREELQVLQLSNNNNSISNNNNGTTNGQSDFTSIVNHFRSFLKYLNTIIVTVSDENHHINNNNNGGSGGKQSYRSTCLLEQLKYPKIIEQFINPDRIFHQFNRIQCTMLTKYLSQQQQQQFQPLQPLDVVTASAASTLSLSSSVVEKQLQLNGAKTSTSTNEPDIITEEIFVQNLIQLMPTSSTSS
ncbi:hypothetical protein DERP_011484 [Dermatophagoides pteronyssinus]|uniref:Uncharacterized protein n=1 Tax=Dermatophagoides pteronyssinus TaxID=6956 RepID=A0ABQ8J5B6_DERPT|nr:hypothetical protein DERP_011484 [Dermatophagoides pteronyssinus]